MRADGSTAGAGACKQALQNASRLVADALRELLDATELNQLFEAYADWLASRNPLGQAKSLEEVEAVLSALGKGMTPPSRLNAFDSSTLRSALHSLACQRERLMSSSSSPSSPSTEPAATL